MSVVEKAIGRLKSRAPERPAEPAARETTWNGAAEAQPAYLPEAGTSVPAELQPGAELLRFSRRSTEGGGFSLDVLQDGKLRTQLRGLRNKVLDSVKARRDAGMAPVIVVTSAAPGDGKSFVALHLAQSFASDQDLEPTLVDADIVRQQSSRLFSAVAGPGLAGCLGGDKPLTEALCATDIPNLRFLPAGTYSNRVLESITDARWMHAVSEMHAAGPSRVFVVDSSPLLATTEAHILARGADLVLFVVRAGVTLQPSVKEAVSRLSGEVNVAFVFNGRVSVGEEVYYGYSYYGEPGDADQK